jgi:hypothetical protein
MKAWQKSNKQSEIVPVNEEMVEHHLSKYCNYIRYRRFLLNKTVLTWMQIKFLIEETWSCTMLSNILENLFRI